MFNRLGATLLCFFLFFSSPGGGFCATGFEAALLENFKPLQPPARLPPVLVSPLQGEKVPLSELAAKSRKRIKLIHLWSPSCPPCVAEMKDLDAALKGLNDHDIEIFLIAQDSQALHSVPAFLRRYALTHVRPWLDEGQVLERALAPGGLPATYLLSDENLVTAEKKGMLDWQALLAR